MAYHTPIERKYNMAEQFDLDTAIASSGGTANWQVGKLVLDWTKAVLIVGLVGENGETRNLSWEGDAATDLMVALNKANLSSNSLQKRILTQLAEDEKIGSGSTTGTPT